MHSNGYVLPSFSRWDGVGRLHYYKGLLYSSRTNLNYWLDRRFERYPVANELIGQVEAAWKLPRPPEYNPMVSDAVSIIGKGPSGKEATGDWLIGINHWPQAAGRAICIMQDFQKPTYRADCLTLISDELIPLFNKQLYPEAGPVAMIPKELQGKDPTALVACKLFAASPIKLFGFEGVFTDDNAPEHYKSQRKGLAPFYNQE